MFDVCKKKFPKKHLSSSESYFSGEAKFIRILANYCFAITKQNRRSFLYALRTGRFGVVEPLLLNFPCTFGKQLEDIFLDPLPIFGTLARLEAVMKEIFSMLKEMIVYNYAAWHNNTSTFEVGINCIGINATDDNGFTLLMLAVENV